VQRYIEKRRTFFHGTRKKTEGNRAWRYSGTEGGASLLNLRHEESQCVKKDSKEGKGTAWVIDGKRGKL